MAEVFGGQRNIFMTKRERYVECLTFGNPDHLIFQHSFGLMPGVLERWHIEGLPKELEVKEIYEDNSLREYFGFDQKVSGIPVNFGLYPSFEVKTIEETDEDITYRDSLGTIRKLKKGITSLALPIKFPVKTQDDWEEKYKVRLQYSSGRFGKNWKKHYQKIRDQGLPVKVGWPGFYWFPRDLMGDENLCLAYYLRPELVHDILDTYENMLVAVSEELLREIEVDEMHMAEDMCYRNAMMISPDTFREFMLPHYKRLIDLYQDYGTKIFSVDTDGNLNQLVPLLIEAGINVILPCEVQAGNDIVKMRKKYGDSMAFVGGINKRALADEPVSLVPRRENVQISTKQAIDEELEYRLPLMLKTGGYIAGLDHRVLPETSLENFIYCVRKVRKYLGMDFDIPALQILLRGKAKK